MIFNVLQTAWSLVAHSYADNATVCYGYLVSGRDIPIDRVQDAIGPYINMLVQELHLSDSTVRHYLKYTSEKRRFHCGHGTSTLLTG